MNRQIEIDLGLSNVSDGALAILERTGGATRLPQSLFSGLLDALTEEHLRRFGSPAAAPARLRMSRRELDTDELWHSLRLLGKLAELYGGGVARRPRPGCGRRRDRAHVGRDVRGALLG